MPWLVPSHQAPVLPLKRWKPEWFSGLALVLGTAVPDLVFILRLDEGGSVASHTFSGQFLITMPLVVVLHAVATTLVLPWLVPRLPSGPPFHPHALSQCRPATGSRALVKVALSGSVGGLSHVVIDGFTHGNHAGWALPLLPVLGTKVGGVFAGAPLHDVLQVVLTVFPGIAALREWDRIARSLPAGARAPASRSERRTMFAVLIGAALSGAWVGPVLRGAEGSASAKLAVYGAITACLVTITAIALLSRGSALLERIRVDTGVAFES